MDRKIGVAIEPGIEKSFFVLPEAG